MGFAELHARFPHLRGANGDEQVLLVFFQLGALVGGNRVFQRQRMQAEFVAEAGDGLAVRRLEFDPDEAIILPDVVADVVESDAADVSILEKLAVDVGLQGVNFSWILAANEAPWAGRSRPMLRPGPAG
jgi:hypothetical protein